MRRQSLAWFSPCVVVLLTCHAFAGTLILNPSADTMIRDTESLPPGDGSSEVLACGTTREGQHARILLQFDFSSLPTNVVVTNAVLRLVVFQSPNGGAIAPYGLHRLFLPWDELLANWTNTGLVDWAQPGGMPGPDYVALPAATNNIDTIGTYLFSDPALLSDVLLWITNDAVNQGWMLRCETEEVFQSAKRFTAREYPDSTLRPQLILYHNGPDEVPPGPRLRNPRVEGGIFSFDFVAEPGNGYSIEYKDNLSDEWMPYDYYADPGVEFVFTVSDTVAPQRFFRIVVQ